MTIRFNPGDVVWYLHNLTIIGFIVIQVEIRVNNEIIIIDSFNEAHNQKELFKYYHQAATEKLKRIEKNEKEEKENNPIA